MADELSGFTIQIDLGARQSPTVVAQVLTDIAQVTEAAQALAVLEARHSATNAIKRQAVEKPGLLQERLMRLELLDVRREQTQEAQEWFQLIRDLEHFPPFPRRYWNRYWPSSELPSVLALLAARDAEERLGQTPVVERITYQNPLEIVLLASSVNLWTLGWFLRLMSDTIRDWEARRRIAKAAAADFEDQVAAKARLRRIILDRYEAGTLQASPQEVDAVIGSGPAEALLRLSKLDSEVLIATTPDHPTEGR